MTLRDRIELHRAVTAVRAANAAKPDPRLPEWRRRALEAHRKHGWVAEKEVAA